MENNLQKIFSHRLVNLRLMVKLLRLAPFVHCVILNGSMAEDFICHPEQSEGSHSKILQPTKRRFQNDNRSWHIKPSSDIDILIIAESGKIYTCRAVVLFWATLTGQKRSNNEKKSHAGRFCFNYFLTESFLTIPHDRGKEVDKYCAENYSKSILLWGDQKIFEKFLRINSVWMKNFLSQSVIARSKATKQSIMNRLPRLEQTQRLAMTEKRSILQISIEKILSKRFGNWLEYTLKNIQIKRIKKDPAVKKYPEYIVFNDNELRFHYPKSR